MPIEPIEPDQLKTDADGNVILFPVTAWIAGSIAETSIILAFQYAETQAALESGETKMMQYAIHPQSALQIAAKLKILAERLLSQPSPCTPPN